MTGEMIQALVALDSEVDRSMIESLVARDPRVRVIDYLELGGPVASGLGVGDALIVAVADYTAEVREFVTTAIRQHPARPVILVCPVDGNGHLGDVLSTGVEDVVALPAETGARVDPELTRHLVFALEKALIRRRGGGHTKPRNTQNIICVLGLKGGCGKTLTTANLGVALAQQGARVALIDLDLQFGDLALAMGLRPERTIYDLVRSGGSLDAEKLEDFLVEHPSGARALLAPVRPDQAAVITVPFLAEVERLLAESYEFVVIDTPPSFGPEVIGAIDCSTDVVMVTMRDTLSLKNTRLGLETLERMDYDRGRVKIVFNRANTNVGIEREDVLAILGRDVDVLIPSHREIAKSVNQGTPIVLDTASDAAKAFKSLAGLYVDASYEAPPAEEEPQPARKSLFRLGWSEELMELHERLSNHQELHERLSPATPAAGETVSEPFSEVKNRVHMTLIEDLGRALFNTEIDQPTLELRVHEELRRRLGREAGISREDRERLVSELADDILGHGPLERLLDDETVSEIMVNGPFDIWVERSGRLHKTPIRFTDESHLRRIISKIVAQVGRRIDEGSPMVDARLPDGSRVNAVIPPLTLTGSLLTIRKFSNQKLDLQKMASAGSLNPETVEFLTRCVQARLNILISGGTGAGKTTLLNALSGAIPDHERIVTIEDAAELQLSQRHVLRLESRPKNIEGEGEVAIRDLVRNSLRMRPDRIVVGEVRGGEALDMLQAMNTGHDGSLSTLHANSPRDALTRLETMVLMAGYDLPLRAVREQISSAVDLMIHIERMQDGGRRVAAITEVQRMESDVITLQDLYSFEVEGVARKHVVGQLKPTGFRPSFADKFERRGIEVLAGAGAAPGATSPAERADQIRANRVAPNGRK